MYWIKDIIANCSVLIRKLNGIPRANKWVCLCKIAYDCALIKLNPCIRTKYKHK